MNDASEMLTASIIALIMEAVSTSVTSVSFYEAARRNIPEVIHRYTRLRKKLKFRN
jgi:hypothetical protein